MSLPPRPRSERLLNAGVARRILFAFGPLETLAAPGSFLFASVLAGWHLWETLTGSGSRYVEAPAMTFAGIVMAQVGAAVAWRTDRESVFSIGLLSNRLLLIGIAAEVAMIGLLPGGAGERRAALRASGRGHRRLVARAGAGQRRRRATATSPSARARATASLRSCASSFA